MPEVQAALRGLTGYGSRVAIDERAADKKLWRYLLTGTDIVLCPYSPGRYTSAYSALAVEAVANGLPIVVPAKTSLSRFAVEQGAGAVAFDEFTAESVANATTMAIANFDQLAERSYVAAVKWNSQNRRALLADAIIG
jgi:hypothetical protein